MGLLTKADLATAGAVCLTCQQKRSYVVPTLNETNKKLGDNMDTSVPLSPRKG